MCVFFFFFFQAEDGIRDLTVTGVQTCALPILVSRELEDGGGWWRMVEVNTARSACFPTSSEPISRSSPSALAPSIVSIRNARSEEHTSELQSQSNLVCRLLLEKKKNVTERSHCTTPPEHPPSPL